MDNINVIYILFVSIFVPILLMALLVEEKARLPILFMLVGIFVSVFASEVNGLLEKTLPLSKYEMTVTVTPVTEEICKALPVFYYALVLSDKKEKLFTASMATGVGFAVLENAFYLLNSPNFSMLNAVTRAFGAGLMHGMCTLLVGVGISFVRKKSKLFAVGTILESRIFPSGSDITVKGNPKLRIFFTEHRNSIVCNKRSGSQSGITLKHFGDFLCNLHVNV